MDPRQVGRLSESLLATTRLSWGGLAHQAVAAIENACLDIHAKALGVPVYALFGGPFRERVPVYWTHCGSYRVRHAAFYEKELGLEPVRTLDDFTRLGREAVQQGFRAVKTNPVFFDRDKPYMFNGGFRIEPGFLDRSISDRHIGAIADQLDALRDGIGPDRGLMLDVSFSQRTEGYLRLARRLEPLDLYWLELDMRDPEGLALIRQSTGTPIASLELLHGIHDFRPYLVQRAVDTAIVDPMWNGVWQSVRVATLADAFETHVAPHNPVGDLANLMSAHFCAAIPNFRIMELRPDEAPWTRDFLTHPVDDRERRDPRADASRLGLRHQRGSAEGASAPVGALGRSADARRLLGPDAAGAATSRRRASGCPGSRARGGGNASRSARRAERRGSADPLRCAARTGAAGGRRLGGAGQHGALDAFPYRGPGGFRCGRTPARRRRHLSRRRVAPTVAEHAMTLLLALTRRVPAMLEEQAKRNWSRLDVSAKATSVEGKVMTIVGYGQIGRQVALRARPFGIRTIGVSRTRKSDDLLDESCTLSELDQALGRADIVMLTIALTRGDPSPVRPRADWMRASPASC